MSVAYFIQQAVRMRRIMQSSVSSPALPHFSTSSHKRHNFRKTLLNIKHVYRFSLQLFFSEALIILRSIRPDTVINTYVFMHSVRYSCQILMQLEFSRRIFSKTLKYQPARKPLQWKPSCSMRTYGQTDMTKLTVAFINFTNAPKQQREIFYPMLP